MQHLGPHFRVHDMRTRLDRRGPSPWRCPSTVSEHVSAFSYKTRLHAPFSLSVRCQLGVTCVSSSVPRVLLRAVTIDRHISSVVVCSPNVNTYNSHCCFHNNN